jgi:hypothetical protein
MSEIEKMKTWFYTLKPEKQLELTIACRWYAYHLDTYLNSIYRKKMYPRLNLIRHANLLYDEDEHRFWIGELYLYNTFENKLCNTETINESPFAIFIGKSPILLSEYIKEIEKCTIYMDHVFIRSNLYYTIDSPITVYRGLNIPKGAELSLYMTGITSVSTNIDNARTFAFSVYQNDDNGEPILYSESESDSYLIELELPINTLIIPMNICTIQEENEFIIISQGICEETSRTREEVINLKPYFNLDEQLINRNKGMLSYTKINATFIPDGSLPEYTKFNISNIMDNVIDDYDYT